MVLYGGLTALALFMLGVVRASGGWVTLVALILLLTGTSGTLAVIGPYAAEVYPTSSRGVASGVAAGFGKAGGVVGPLLVSSLLAAFPGVWVAAFAVAVPMALATVTVGLRGLDTRQPSQREHGIETWVTADVAEGGPR
jgi:putative MFS transporter